MNNVKNKSLRIFLALCLMVQMVMPGMVWESKAATTGTANETVNYLIDNAAANYLEDVFKIYQLLEGTSPDYNVSSNLATQEALKKVLNVSSSIDYDIVEALDAMAGDNSSNSEKQQLALALESELSGENTDYTFTANGRNLTTTVAKGYYLVICTDDNLGYPPVLILVDGEQEDIKAKTTLPSFDKAIYHNEVGNSSSNPFADTTTGAWTTVGDNQIGDDVYFRVTTTLPTAISTFGSETYYQVLVDTMPVEQFYYDGNYIITVTDKDGSVSQYADADNTTYDELSSDPEISFTPDDDRNDTDGWELQFSLVSTTDLLGAEITVEYTAVLLETAIVGTDANTNTVELTYSTVPDSGLSQDFWDGDVSSSGNGTTDNTDTGSKTVYDWTFSLVVDKINNASTPESLPDAEFELQDDSGTPFSFTQNSDGEYYFDASGSTVLKTAGADGTFTILGLDDDKTYVLVETLAPEKHVSAEDDMTFSITAEYRTDGTEPTNDDGATLNIFKATANTVHATSDAVTVDKDSTYGSEGAEGAEVSEYTHIKVESTGDGIMTATVVNKQNNISLPETGGIGTIMFYVAGIGMMAAAGFLIYKRKES